MSKSMNLAFFNAFSILLFSTIFCLLLLLTQFHVFGMMVVSRNKPSPLTPNMLNLDEEYTNLLLLFKYDSAKRSGIEEENLKRRMQFRLIAWNFAHKYGRNGAKRKLLENSIGDMVKFACDLWNKTAYEALKRETFVAQSNPEYVQNIWRKAKKEWANDPWDQNDLIRNQAEDCTRLEFHMDNPDPNSEWPEWVRHFFRTANELHMEEIKKLLGDTAKEQRNNFKFWWSAYRECMQKRRDEKELKKALELEDAEAKMGRSKAIIPFMDQQQQLSVVKQPAAVAGGESQFLQELRRMVINSISMKGNDDFKVVKSQIVDMTSAFFMTEMEQFDPILFDYGSIEKRVVHSLYNQLAEDLEEAQLARVEYRLSSALLYGRIRHQLFKQLQASENDEGIKIHKIETHFRRAFEIASKFKQFDNEHLSKHEAQQICWQLLQLWRQISADESEMGEAEEVTMSSGSNYEQRGKQIRDELLWNEHWSWLDFFKNWGTKLLDSNWRPGNVHKFAEFFGGFVHIWAKIHEMEKKGQKPEKFNEDENGGDENFVDKMLTPFRTKLVDFRIIYYIEDYFDQILQLHNSHFLKNIQLMWKAPDQKRSRWALDLLIWLLALDEHFDQIAAANSEAADEDKQKEQLVNHWWNVRVEIEIFHDSMAIRDGGYEGIEKPALNMMNWMYLLKHQKCIENDEKMSKEKNQSEMHRNLLAYIEKCKKLSEKYTNKQRKFFDDDEMRSLRRHYFKQLLAEDGSRFHSVHMVLMFERKLDNAYTLKMVEELMGHEVLAEIPNIIKENIHSDQSLVEKWIEILQITNKKVQFQANLDFMYYYANNEMAQTKMFAQKFQTVRLAFRREFAKKVYDTIMRIEATIADALRDANAVQIDQREKEIAGTHADENNNERTKQIQLVRSIKMINDFTKMIRDGGLANLAFYDTIKMTPFGAVRDNFRDYVEELRNFQMGTLNYRRFAQMLREQGRLQTFLRDTVGAMHAMDTMLGYNEEEKKRNIEAIWESFKGGSVPLDATGISRVGEDGQLNIPARDIDFFNDKRLVENYVLAFQQQNNPQAHASSSSADVPSPHLLAANIIVFMQNFESTVMRSSNNGQKMQHIRAKYGELIRLLARIEYDKLLTDLESINYEVQREFFALLTAELKNNKFGKKEMIPGIVINYRHENIAFENKNNKILKNYDNKLGELHSKAMIRLLELEKEGKKLEINEYGKKGKEQTLAKILQDANSVQKKRRILFNFLGNFENISKVFAKIGSRGMKIRTNDYAQFVEEKMQKEREVEMGEGESDEEYFDALDLELEQEQQKKNVEKHFSSVEASGHVVVDAEIAIQKKSWADMASDESELDIAKEDSGSSDTVEREKIQKGGKNAQQEEKMKQIEIVDKETPELVQGKWEEMMDVQSSADGGSESEVASESKTKRRRQKKKLAKEAKMVRKEEEAKELKAKKIEEKKQQEDKEFVLLPINEVDGQKFQGRMIPAFEKYFDDKFLQRHFLSQYEQFVAERRWSPEEHLLITIGTYLNELGKKWKAMEQMQAQKMALANTINWELIAESRQILLKWGDNGLRKEREWTVGELHTLMDKLHETLVDVLAEIDGGPFSKSAVGKKPMDTFYEAQMRRQLNWICFARAIYAEQRLAAMWSPQQDAGGGANSRRAYNREFVALIGTIDGVEIEGAAVMEQQKQQKVNSLERLLDQFEREYLQPFKLMMAQNEIDRELISEYQPNNEAADNVEFHQLAQQFRWSGEQVHQGRAITQQLLSDVDYSDANDEGISSWREGLDVAIERVQHIVTKIWAPQSILKIGGSYQLGAWTPNSEINAILVASKRVGRERFFGNASGKCESNRWCLDINSLYCQLCHNKNVFHLVRRPDNHIPHLKFIYCTNFARHQMDYPQAKLPAFQCAPFELALASVPGYGTISDKTLQNTWLLIDRFREREEDIYEINWQDARAGMIHALSGYHLNEEILAKLVNKNMLRVFRICLVVLKKWAKNNHIYNGAYGFMNGASLALMLLKTLLRFPISPTVPFILEQFFAQFANWSWPMPVQFARLGDDRTEAKERKLGWRADRERAQKMKMWRSKVRHIPGGAVLPTLNMPIIAPCKPERNVAYSVNHSTQHIIQGELAKGLELMKKIRMKQKQSQEIEDAKRLWKSLLMDTQPFAKKYTHYLVLYCFAKKELGDEFCGDYVLYQLRLQLIFSVERNPSAGGILQCHILPSPNDGSSVNKSQQAALYKISKKLPVPSEFRNSLNRYWIIGLEFGDEAVARMGKPEFGKNLEHWLNFSQYGFVEQFKQDYFIFSMRRQLDKTEIHQKISSQHLFTKFVPADQLDQWVIEETSWLKKQKGKSTSDVESGKF